MNRTIFLLITILACSFSVGAETVSIKGTVKRTGGITGIQGAKVSLSLVSGLSATTDADGTFALTGNTSSIKLLDIHHEPVRFIIKDNTIVLAPTSKDVSGRIALFSCQGKVLSSVRFQNPASGNNSFTFPRLSSGVSIIQVTIGARSFTRTLVRVGDSHVMNNEALTTGNGSFRSAKLPALTVDTLIVEKEGYVTKKAAIDQYIIDSMTITLDSVGGGSPEACTRESLKAIADAYIAAQKAGDPSTLPLASEITYTQDNKASTADKCIWKTAMVVDHSLSFFDVDSCRTFVEIISSTGSTPWVIMTWLKVDGGKISGVDAMVSTTGDFMFSAQKYLSYVKVQDWSILTESQRVSRQELIDGADAYLDMFSDGVDNVPWGSPCERVEGGNMHVTPDCIQGMPGHGGMGGTVNITNRRYTVDVDMGTVDVFCSFGGSMPDSHMFRLIDGKIRLVHTLSLQ